MELLRRFHGVPSPRSAREDRRTVAELLDAAAEDRRERKRRAETERAAVLVREEQGRRRKRQERLDAVANDVEGTWNRVEALINARLTSEYDTAIEFLKDLHAIAQRTDNANGFDHRCAELRRQHLRRSAFIQRLDRAGLRPG
jgi:hypothetical protein